VILDGNHPLAGEDLIFDVEVTGNRDATEEEIAGLKEQIAQMAKSVPPQDPAPESGGEPTPPASQA